MAALLTPTQLREHVDTDRSDVVLQAILDEADADITRRYGEHATGSETFRPQPMTDQLFLSRSVSSITTVTETSINAAGETATILSANDYALEGKRTLRRKAAGDNSSMTWDFKVVVVYAPVSDAARRTMVTVDLCRIALRYQAAHSVKAGDFTVSHVDYIRERELVLRRLQPSLLGAFA